ncbi:MAG: hypothetical protein FWG39_01320 [Alphaproteobacteria bacterium]|nr:hypothetical protein [Alphaproteobacteria bacterium]
MTKSPALPNDSKLLLAIHSLHKISSLFLGTFLISFIMQNSVNEILSVSLYELFTHMALGVGFFILADWVKRKDKVSVFKLNLIPKIICLGAIVFLKESIIHYIVPLAIVYGMHVALYWSPLHVMTGEKIPADLMSRFVSYRSLVSRVTKVVAPLILGLFITAGSYEDMAVALLVLCFVEFGLMFFMKPSMHRLKKKVDLFGFWRCMMRFPVIRRLFFIETLRGFSIDGALGTIVIMYTVYMFKTDLNLGIFTTIFSIFAIGTAFLFGRFGRKSAFSRLMFASTLAALCSLALFVTYTSEITFLIYNFVYVTAIAVMDIIAETNMYCLSKSKCVTKNHKVEYFLFRESALNAGRTVAYTSLFLVGIFGGYEWLRWYLVVLTAAIVMVGFMSIRINSCINN